METLQEGKMKREMKEFTVTWTIELAAESHLDAAWTAHNILQDPDSTATVFDVEELDSCEIKRIDLLKESQ